MLHLLLYNLRETDFAEYRNLPLKRRDLSRTQPGSHLKEEATMQRSLATAILFVALCSDVGLCRRSSSSSKRNKKISASSASKLPDPTTASTTSGNLCHGGLIIDDVAFEPQDAKFYKENWKDFPSGLYYPDCVRPLQPNATKESYVSECVSFTMTSSKLNLPEGKNSSDQKARVMWHVINHLCAEDSSCVACSSNGGLGYWDQLLMISLISCVLAAG